MISQEAVNIVLGSDKNGILGLAVTVKSVLCTTSRPCNFYILSLHISLKDQIKLRNSWQHPKTNQVIFYNISDQDISGLRPTMYLKNRSTYIRLILDKVLPSKLERCLWLDSDLFINSDICQVYDMDLENDVIGAVKDISTKHLDDKIRHHLQQDLGCLDSSTMS